MSRVHVRCGNSKCRVRQVFPKSPSKYIRPRKCWSCGENRWTVDGWMNKRDTRAMGCTCLGYNWGGAMHRKGSKFCWYRADGSTRAPGDPDFNDTEYEVENEYAETS